MVDLLNFNDVEQIFSDACKLPWTRKLELPTTS